MDQEVREHREAWVAALRSGEYSAAAGQLRVMASPTGGGYCCLGVACDRYAEATGEGHWDGSEFVTPGDRNVTYAPPVVLEYFGLTDQGRKSYEVKDTDSQHRYAEMNDQEASFEEIADAVEKHLL